MFTGKANSILRRQKFSYAGVSRSTSCVIAYLMKERKMGFFEALQLTRARRPIICPNMGFAQ